MLGSGFGLQDMIDILLITVVLYQIYKLLIGSRAWHLLRGITMLALIWIAAAQLGLPVTQWLFDSMAPAAFIALVVIFQPELRAMLEHVGRTGETFNASGDPVQEVIGAVRELANQSCGALIVIERVDPLSEYGKVGSPLGSPVSTALLHTIFNSKGPLHDGGVIIKNAVITFAGAVFPVSDKREGVPSHLGTRHRAAIGITEESDALAVIVSEERGTVSLAQGGSIRVDVAPAEVLKALREVYTSS